jgi:hypothetical protein
MHIATSVKRNIWRIIFIITYGSILLFFYWPEAIHVTFQFLLRDHFNSKTCVRFVYALPEVLHGVLEPSETGMRYQTTASPSGTLKPSGSILSHSRMFLSLLMCSVCLRFTGGFARRFFIWNKIFSLLLLLLPECGHHQYVDYSATLLDAHAIIIIIIMN